MDNTVSPAGRVQSPPEAHKEPTARQGFGERDALDARMDDTHNVATHSGDAGIPTSNSDTKSPTRPTIGLASSATTAASSPQQEPHDAPPESGTVPFDSLLAALAKLAAFTDVFLSGLVIPLIPPILETRAGLPRQQVQIWTSVGISAYGGAFAVVSPLMPILTRRGPSLYAVLFAGLGCAAAAFAILQLSSQLRILILARVLQGFAGAATTAACSGMLAQTAAAGGRERTLASFSPAFTQNTAMMVAPAIAGLVHDWYGISAVFYCAYGLVLLNFLLGFVAARFSSTTRLVGRSEHQGAAEPRSSGYGTIASATGQSARSSRSVSPTSAPPGSSGPDRHSSLSSPAAWSPRLLAALYGYLVVGLLASALYSVLPLFVQRQLQWSVSASGLMFVPLSAPAALIGPLAGMLAVRVPKSTRYLATVGFLACIPAFLYLSSLRGDLTASGDDPYQPQNALLVVLVGLSFALGLCGDPLAREVTSVVGSSAASNPWSATAQATSLPNLANAWGSLVGPLLAGGLSWIYGWEIMNKSLAVVGAGTGLITLLFLQGWIGNPHPELRRRRLVAGSDEESAPLLANDRSNRTGSYGQSASFYDKKAGSYVRADDSDDQVSPHTRKPQHHRTHRRHFSVDNFSIATTAAAPGSLDSSTSSVRFQAALETPVAPPTNRSQSTDLTAGSISTAAAPERRYIMREAPHSPATDPLLAAGSLYVIDEERNSAGGSGDGLGERAGTGTSTTTDRKKNKKKKRVVVFAEGAAPPELLERHRHHVVAINALDGSAQMVESVGNGRVEGHAVAVTEEEGEAEFEEGAARRYVVVVVEEDERDGEGAVAVDESG